MHDYLSGFEKIRMLSDVNLFFGNGKREKSLKLLEGKSVLLVCSRRTQKLIKSDLILNEFFSKTRLIKNYYVNSYPEIDSLEVGIKKLNKTSFDCILAIGGGSVIDTAKIIKAIFLSKTNSIRNLLKDKSLLDNKNNDIKLIALPTTAGTGSEVTPYATIWDFKFNKKYSITYSCLVPNYSIIDPDFLINIPSSIVIPTGLDAINQAFDSICNNAATDETIEVAIIAIKYGIDNLPAILGNSFNSKERSLISLASLFSGVCISKTKTSICHSISYPLTSHFGVPHGLACAFTMNAVLKMIDQNNDQTSKKFKKNIERIWFKYSENNFYESINVFVRKMKISERVKKYINSFDDLIAISNEMYTPERMDNFILPIDYLKIREILKESWNT